MIGYDLSSDTLQAGETLTLRNYYRVNQPRKPAITCSCILSHRTA
jgi:hypothetical protein